MASPLCACAGYVAPPQYGGPDKMNPANWALPKPSTWDAGSYVSNNTSAPHTPKSLALSPETWAQQLTAQAGIFAAAKKHGIELPPLNGIVYKIRDGKLIITTPGEPFEPLPTGVKRRRMIEVD